MVHSSHRPLTGEDRRMAKKFNKAAREAFISMQGQNLKRSARKHQKMMQFEGSSHKSRSKRDLSGMPLLGDPLHLKRYYYIQFTLCWWLHNSQT
jgi:hypothetical protein